MSIGYDNGEICCGRSQYQKLFKMPMMMDIPKEEFSYTFSGEEGLGSKHYVKNFTFSTNLNIDMVGRKDTIQNNNIYILNRFWQN